MSKDTASFLLELVDALTLKVGAPDFDEVLPKVLQAREELQAIVEGEA